MKAQNLYSNSSLASTPQELDKEDFKAQCEYRLHGDRCSRFNAEQDHRNSGDSGVGNSVSDKLLGDKCIRNFVVRSHNGSDSEDSASNVADVDSDNWHGIDPTRRGHLPLKKSKF